MLLNDLTEDQKFAAVVTGDSCVTGSDAQAILRYLAFFTDSIGSTGQWRFKPDTSTLMLSADTILDFKAYLHGDVNGDWGESDEGTKLAIGLPGKSSNPFNPATTISFDLAFDARVEIRVFNTLGQEVGEIFKGSLPAGNQKIIWNVRDESAAFLPSGVYFYQIKISDARKQFHDSYIIAKKMVLIQ